MDSINLITDKKEPRYVVVYDKLFKMINEKAFPENSRLPSEPKLAEMLGVSRTTLRQALSLLIDDGLVKNIHGKGNYIIRKESKKSNGLEKVGNPTYKCIDLSIDSVELELRIEPPSDYYLNILGQKTVAVVCVDRWYKSKEEYISYTFTIIPIETIVDFNLDLNNKDEILEFLETNIYIDCSFTNTKIKFSTSGNFTANNHPITCDKKFYLIEEGIFKHKEFPIVFNKVYLPFQHSSLNLTQIK